MNPPPLNPPTTPPQAGPEQHDQDSISIQQQAHEEGEALDVIREGQTREITDSSATDDTTEFSDPETQQRQLFNIPGPVSAVLERAESFVDPSILGGQRGNISESASSSPRQNISYGTQHRGGRPPTLGRFTLEPSARIGRPPGLPLELPRGPVPDLCLSERRHIPNQPESYIREVRVGELSVLPEIHPSSFGTGTQQRANTSPRSYIVRRPRRTFQPSTTARITPVSNPSLQSPGECSRAPVLELCSSSRYHIRNSVDPKMATPTPERHQFDRKVDETKISKSDVNNLIMDYLITEGYPQAARRFALEANIQPKADLDTINERVEIRNSIHRGDLQTAIELINELNPELLDTNAALHFSLLRLQLIELIRKIPSSPDTSAVEAALDFASTHLAPRAPTNPQFINDLERTMALLIFRPETWAQQQQYQANVTVPPAAATNGVSQSSNTASSATAQSPFGALSELVDPSLRKKVAKDVNEAILKSQGQSKEARLRQLVRTREWAEKLARDRKIDLPAKLDIGLDGDHTSSNTSNGLGERQVQNGHASGAADTVMAENGTSSGNGNGRPSRTADGDAVLAQFTNIP